MDIIGMLQDGSGALAWLTAILLALGGTAVVVAVWTQVRRGVPVATVLKAAVGIRQARPAQAPHRSPGAGDPKPVAAAPAREAEPSNRAVRAYQAESRLNPAEIAATMREPVPTAPASEPAMLTERQLTVYLNRLRRAADTLEEVARRESASSGGSEDGALLATH
jgi:hypothetical protein